MLLCLSFVSLIKQLIWFLQKKFGVHNESAVLHTTILLDYVCICLCVGAISLHILLCLIKTWFLSSTVCKIIHPSLILIKALPIRQRSCWKSWSDKETILVWKLSKYSLTQLGKGLAKNKSQILFNYNSRCVTILQTRLSERKLYFIAFLFCQFKCYSN